MIGIFDSGLGGFLVVKEIIKKTNLPVLYLGDTAHLPYGVKSKKAIIEFSKKNINFLLKKGAKIIVIACNTSSAVAGDILKKEYEVPIFDVIEPTINRLRDIKNLKRVGIIGTPATIKSKIYEKKIKNIFGNKISVYSKSCPLLVPLIEEGWLYHRVTKEVLKEYLIPLKKAKIDVLILGCTHYPLIKNLISKEIGKRIKILDSSKEVAKIVADFLKIKKVSPKKTSSLKIFLSDEGYNFKKIAKLSKIPLKYKIISDL